MSQRQKNCKKPKVVFNELLAPRHERVEAELVIYDLLPFERSMVQAFAPRGHLLMMRRYLEGLNEYIHAQDYIDLTRMEQEWIECEIAAVTEWLAQKTKEL